MYLTQVAGRRVLNVTLFLRVVLCFSSSLTLSRNSLTASPTSTSRCNCTAEEEGGGMESGRKVRERGEGLGFNVCQVGSFSFMFNAPCRQCNIALSHHWVTVHPSLPPSSHRQWVATAWWPSWNRQQGILQVERDKVLTHFFIFSSCDLACFFSNCINTG